MSEEHKIYVPLRGTHVTPAPYEFTARWYAEQGRPIKPDTSWVRVRRTLKRWLRRAGIVFDREERCLRLGRLFISWYNN